jgi:hypothetical protein
MIVTYVNPSRWSHRAVVVALALVGCAIATYLALYQWRVIDHVFEPFFGDGSRRVLRQSVVAHMLPIPDAFLGALAYAAEVVVASIGDAHRWRTAPRVVLLFGCISAALLLAALALLVAQPLLVNSWCTLCLCSAVISIVLAILATPEVLAAVQTLWHQTPAEET